MEISFSAAELVLVLALLFTVIGASFWFVLKEKKKSRLTVDDDAETLGGAFGVSEKRHRELHKESIRLVADMIKKRKKNVNRVELYKQLWDRTDLSFAEKVLLFQVLCIDLYLMVADPITTARDRVGTAYNLERALGDDFYPLLEETLGKEIADKLRAKEAESSKNEEIKKPSLDRDSNNMLSKF